MRDTSPILASSPREAAIANGTNPPRLENEIADARNTSLIKRYLLDSFAQVFRPSWPTSTGRASLEDQIRETPRYLGPIFRQSDTPFPPDEQSSQGPHITLDRADVSIPMWKRMLDLTCIIVTFPIWLTTMLLVMTWIKVVSPGPVFYRQKRIGYRRKCFVLLKFRSMRVNVETHSHERHLELLIKANCPMNKLDSAGDPRLIPGGRLIRALGLDELPQILNVIRGEMSIVGPRPCTPHEFSQYQPWQRERVCAPPGLTGFWQVNGKNKTTFSEMIAMDIFYTDNMSLCLDCEIILRTASVLISQAIEAQPADRVALAPPKTSTMPCEG